MTAPNAAELQRWSEEVARDPGSPAFVPLADAYRRQGRRDAALRVCLRGLQRHPTHVDAHVLLSKLYLESGERQKAADEWSIVLRLDTGNFDALRGLGFSSLEHGDVAAAERYLGRAAQVRPGERTVAAALELVRQRRGEVVRGARPPVPRATAAVAPSAVPRAAASRPRPSAPAPPPAPEAAPAAVTPRMAEAVSAAAPRAVDPARLFEPLTAEAPFLGALVLDRQGLVVGGALAGAHRGREDQLGGGLGGAIAEAARTALHTGLGQWRGLMLQTADAALHVATLNGDYVVVLVARADAPAGWVVRTARRARELAGPFIEVSA